MPKPTFGSLFAGIGGFDLGFERAGFKCKWQVEIDDYATKVLEKHWPKVHRERDIRQCGSSNLERVDCIIGGFPCQDISYAGRGAGLAGERSGLFFEAVRLVRELQPRAVVLENVAALLTRGLDRVLGTLAEIGYDAQWHCIPAAAVGAPHIRDRVFILAYCKHDGFTSSTGQYPRNQQQQGRTEKSRSSKQSQGSGSGSAISADVADARRKLRESRAVSEPGCEASPYGDAKAKDDQRRGEDVADTNSTRLKDACGSKAITKRYRQRAVSRSSWWDAEPDVGRVANGIPSRVDRLRCLGNAIVPQVAEVVAKMTKQQIDW